MGAEEDKSDGTKEIYRECCRCYVGLYITIPLDKEVDVNAKWGCDYCKDKTIIANPAKNAKLAKLAGLAYFLG